MTETELKTDATKALADIKADLSKLDAGPAHIEAETTTFVKIHLVWIIGLAALALGFVMWHFVR